METGTRNLRHRIEQEVAARLKKAGVRSILVAVSGGADSVALLSLCCSLTKTTGLRVEAVNCNFHLRGDESDRDSRFTAELCSNLGVRLHSLDYDVASFMEQNPGISTEMACRQLRYADFFRLRKELGLDRIAVAHNADDDIETMMLNMLRGSGTRGLRGMDFDNGTIIRPLLSTTRKEIEEYLADKELGFIIDSSNLTSEFRRNFIRREIIPLMEQRWPGARKSLSKTVGIMKEEALIVDSYYESKLAGLRLDDDSLDAYESDMTVGLLLRFLEPYGGNPEIAEEILDATHRDFAERKWRLSERYMAVLERDRLTIADRSGNLAEPVLSWEEMEMSETAMKEIKGNRSQEVVYLPAGASHYELRRPKTGDRMAPLGMRGTRLVSDIISDARLDHKTKDAVRVLARKSDGEIIWVTGLKRSRHDLISDQCHIIFKVNVEPRK